MGSEMCIRDRSIEGRIVVKVFLKLSYGSDQCVLAAGINVYL